MNFNDINVGDILQHRNSKFPVEVIGFLDSFIAILAVESGCVVTSSIAKEHEFCLRNVGKHYWFVRAESLSLEDKKR